VSELGSVTIARYNLVIVARVDGELDLSNWSRVCSEVEDAVAPDDTALVVDLGEISFFDSTGVRLVFQLADRLQTRRQRFALVIGENEIVRRVTELTGITQHVPCHRTVDEAVHAFSAPR
jgi:anti-anti-sigma factor